MSLCGNKLPWVDYGKHLGNMIENKIDGMAKDIMIKRARFISKNIELNQEFHFAHPITKVKVNNIYNTSFSGSTLWNLFSKETEMLEKSWNTDTREMFQLPSETHTFFIEELSHKQHFKGFLIKVS